MTTAYVLEYTCHPGAYIRRNILEPRNLTVMSAASLLGVTRQTLTDILNEKVGLSAELALRIEKVFGCSMDMLMEMQTRFDIAAARKLEPMIESELASRTRPCATGRRKQPIVKRVYALG